MSFLSRILLVDDDEVNNFLNLRLLKRLSLTPHIEVASSGELGLAVISGLIKENKTSPLLIFLDINMPKMNGFEFLDNLKKINLKSFKPIIVMLTTSTNDKDLAQVSLYPEVAGIISKPLTEEKVEEVMKEYFPSLPSVSTFANSEKP